MKHFKIKKLKPAVLSFGKQGEMAAWEYLSLQGYTILERNFTCSLGEIDVVAEVDGVIRFVEIKTRRHHRFGRPEEAVDFRKRKKLVMLAEYYLKRQKKENVSAAFDVLSITWLKGRLPEFNLIRSAFDADMETQ